MHEIHRQLLLSYYRPITFSAILWANDINDVAYTLSDRSNEAIYILAFNIFKYLITRNISWDVLWKGSKSHIWSWHLHRYPCQTLPIVGTVISLTWNLYQGCDDHFKLQFIGSIACTVFVLCQCIVSQNIHSKSVIRDTMIPWSGRLL